MNKKLLSEQEIRSRYIMPALRGAGWKVAQIREEYYFTDGRMNIQSNGVAVRGVIYTPLLALRRNGCSICCWQSTAKRA